MPKAKGWGWEARCVLLAVLWALLLQVSVLIVLERHGAKPVETLFGDDVARRLRQLEQVEVASPLSASGIGSGDDRCATECCGAINGSRLAGAQVDLVGAFEAPPVATLKVTPESEEPPGTNSSHPPEDGPEGTLALFFMLEALIVGIAVLHLTMLEAFRSLQNTVALFVLGLLYALVHEQDTVDAVRGPFAASYGMWMEIDSHLLLHVFLPPLLLGEAMSIDTSVVATVFKQCFYLAGPGVLLNTALTALFVMWLLGWSALLSFLFGAIVSATDPVAVVNLLKELGAPPTLTVLIQGESLLNDGTSIVLYSIIYAYVQGTAAYTTSGIVVEFVKVALGAVAFGLFWGIFFNTWIHAAGQRLSHHADTIQVSLTICCAYLSWIVAEGFFRISGVLCTVTSAIVLANGMWPAIVHRESMMHVWHTIELIMNTLLFFLAGSLTGRVIMKQSITWENFWYLLAIYFAATVIRFVVLVFSKPFLHFLSGDGTEVSFKDILVMTWGGLRGAVGLALAIQVQKDRAGGELDPREGDHVLFYVGGIACLTLVINASSAGALVRCLGITRTTSVKRWMMMGMHRNLEELMKDELSGIENMMRVHDEDAAKKHTEAVSEIISVVLKEVAKDVQLGHTHGHPMLGDEVQPKSSLNLDRDDKRAYRNIRGSNQWLNQAHRREGGTYLSGFWSSQGQGPTALDQVRVFDHVLEEFLDHLERGRFEPFIDLMVDFMPESEMDELRSQASLEISCDKIFTAMNEAMLNLVRSQYWEQIEEGVFAKGTAVAELLLGSVPSASKQADNGLLDLKIIMDKLGYNTSLKESVFKVLPKGPTGLPRSLAGSAHSGVLTHGAARGIDLGTDLSYPPQRKLDSHRSGGVAKAGAHGGIQMTSAKSAKSGHTVNADFRSMTVPTMQRGKSELPDLPGHNDPVLHRLGLVDSWQFNVVMMFIIVMNTVLALVGMTTDVDSGNGFVTFNEWLMIRSVCFGCFFAEFVLKYYYMRRAYWVSVENIFDFIVIIITFTSIVEEAGHIQEKEGHDDLLSLSLWLQICRFVRVFQLRTLMRIVWERLQHGEAGKHSKKLASSMRRIAVLKAYVRAHLKSQKNLLKLFGKSSRPEFVEEALCILASQTNVYRAFIVLGKEAASVDPNLLEEMTILQDSTHLVKNMSHFVDDAYHRKAIDHRQARRLLQPLDTLQAQLQEAIDHPSHGFVHKTETLRPTRRASLDFANLEGIAEEMPAAARAAQAQNP